MALRSRRGGGNGLDAWPGYVDALSTLLMVIIFVLLVFVLAQGFLSVALSGRDKALDQANRQMAELTNALALEKSQSTQLQLSVSQLGRDLSVALSERDRLTQRIAEAAQALQAASAANARLQDQVAERDRIVEANKQTIEARLSDLARLAEDTRALTALRDELQRQLKATSTVAATEKQQREATQAQLLDAGRQLAMAQQRVAELQRQIEDMQRTAASFNQTVVADKATVEAKVADLARLADQVRALTALRDEFEKQARAASERAATEEQKRAAALTQLGEEKRLGETARAQLALLNQQLDELKAQFTAIAQRLELANQKIFDKDAQLDNLGQRLNVALAAKVEELQQYRSDFFGKLRRLMENRSGIQVVGDRFVFQSEVLFPVGSADLTQAGVGQMTTLAVTIKEVAAAIPADMPWVMRVDGHTDRQPVRGGIFASNWELSSARAITVVKLLISFGVAPQHLAATGFGEYQPLGPLDTPDAYAKDRRIEIRLTDR
jgi:chemotaxis protein MotB